jgi:signal transduction histidine kinase
MKWLSYVVISYMLLALIWWTILLYRKNQEAFDAKVELLHLQSLKNKTSIFSTEEYQLAQKEYKKQASMIMGEGMVFGISLLVGIWLIQRAFEKELLASRKQNNFVLAVTHELKSPLTSINLGLETLKKRKLDHEMVQDIADTAHSESIRLQKLIDQLLLTAKMDNKETIYRLENHKLSNLVQAYIDQFRANRKDVNILDRIQKDLSANIDPLAIETVLSNLLENAVKYAKDKPITIELSKAEQKISLSVSDQGEGISEIEKKRIFDKFYRVGSEETRRTKGTGLGLYICKKIADVHSGTLTVKDNHPKGSIFELKLPEVV